MYYLTIILALLFWLPKDRCPVLEVTITCRVEKSKNDTLLVVKSSNDDGEHSTGNTYQILSVVKVTDTTSQFSSKYKEHCVRWKLSNEEIVRIFKKSIKISGEDFHHFYSVLPCSYEGKILINGQNFHFQLNAGSFIAITSQGNTSYLGYIKNDASKYFLASPEKY